MNDLKPVALTSVAMKTCEHLALKFLKPIVDQYLDLMQFVYRSNVVRRMLFYSVSKKLYSHLEHTNFLPGYIFYIFRLLLTLLSPTV